MKTCFTFFFLISVVLYGIPVETFYGPIEVEEPVLLELITSPGFQRLKFIHQYGVAYYTTHKEDYHRYDHSLGVFALLRLNNASLEEQIAGLLHDVSHTVFSHVGDWIFPQDNLEKDYQGSIHGAFLEKYGFGEILTKHGFSVDQVIPLEEWFPMLEQKGPALCADRIDYNIQGAYYQHFITYDEALQIVEDLQFIEGRWVSSQPELMKKLVRFSLFMTEGCWGSPRNHLMSSCLADAIHRGVGLGKISYEDIHFGTDDLIWERLISSEDPTISKKMEMVLRMDEYYHLTDQEDAELIIKSKFRGIDPWIFLDGRYVQLTAISSEIETEYHLLQEKMLRGWGIIFSGKP